MHSRSFSPMPWREVGLAILPGLFVLGASSGLFRLIFGEGIGQALIQNGLIAVLILLSILSLSFIRERRLAVWSYPALGILLFYVWALPMALISWLFDYSDDVQSQISNLLYFAIFAAMAILATYTVHRSRGMPRLGWVLLCLMILVSVGTAIVSTIADGSQDISIIISFWLAFSLGSVLALLLPVGIGLPLARRNGLLAGLVVVAAEFGLVETGLDPDYALGIWTSNQALVLLVRFIPAISFLVISPIWVLRSRSTPGRILGLLVPPIIALMMAEGISGAVRPYYTIATWLREGLITSQFVIALALAAVMYRWIERQGQAALGTQKSEGTLDDQSAATTQDLRLAAPPMSKFPPSLPANT